MRVSQNGRPPGADVIDVLVAVHIPDAGTFGPVNEERLAANAAKCAHRRIHASRNTFESLGEQLVRKGMRRGCHGCFLKKVSRREPRSVRTRVPAPILFFLNQPCGVSRTNWILS